MSYTDGIRGNATKIRQLERQIDKIDNRSIQMIILFKQMTGKVISN